MTERLLCKKELLSENAFLDGVSILEEEHCREQFKLRETRQLLEGSPLNTGVLAGHGELLAELLHEVGVGDSNECLDQDAKLLAHYLDCITKTNPVDLLQSSGGIAGWSHTRNRFVARRPIYDALMNTMHALSTPEGIERSHPVLLKGMELGLVHPAALLSYFSTFIQAQTDYLSDIQDTSNSFQYTAYGKWLVALRPLMLDLNWRPTDERVYAMLWLAHCGESRVEELKERNEAFMRLMAQGHGSCLHFGLWYLLKMQHASDAALDAFFPLSLDKCCVLEVLTHLLGLSFGNSSKSERFTKRLMQHHPGLANILQMHLLMFPDLESALDHANAMVESFERLWTGPAEIVVADDLFETQA